MPTLYWTEPNAFHRHASAERRRSGTRPRGLGLGLAGLATFGLLMAATVSFAQRVGRGERFDNLRTVIPVALAMAAALFMAFGWPHILNRLIRATILLSDRGVSCDTPAGRGVSVSRWDWDEIARARLVRAEVGGQSRPALELLAKDGTRLGRLGLADEPTSEQIAAYFRSRRIPIDDQLSS